MNISILLIAAVMILSSCSGVSSGSPDDTRFIVLGPSLVELMFESGLGERVTGVDRYSDWPDEVRSLPQVGGYIDPSLERIVALQPTSIHVSGESAVLRELALTLDIPCYSYRFDTLEDVFNSLDSLDARYGANASDFKRELTEKLDSLKVLLQNTPLLTVMIVIYHEKGSSSMTVAGQTTYYADLLESVGCEISSPGTGSWPMISAEGVIELSPDHIICLHPGVTDTSAIASSEDSFFEGLGFEPGRVHTLFDSFIMIPGGRIGLTAERICSCLH